MDLTVVNVEYCVLDRFLQLPVGRGTMSMLRGRMKALGEICVDLSIRRCIYR